MDFSALHFLLRKEPQLAKKLKLKELLLLVLRTLLVIAIPIALARPYLPQDSPTSVSNGRPRSVVVVMEHGLNQWVKDDQGGGKHPLFERTKEHVVNILEDLPPGSTVNVVLAGARPKPVSVHLSNRRQELVRTIKSLKASYSPADMRSATMAAREILMEEGLEQREIHIVGRIGTQELESINELKIHECNLNFTFIRRKTPAVNLRLLSAHFVRTEEGGTELSVRLENQSAEDQTPTVTLEMDGQVIRRAIGVEKQGTTDVAFSWPKHKNINEGKRRATLRITGDDFHPDDSLYMVDKGLNARSILLVNGSPRPVRFQDELFFLSRALESLADHEEALRVESIAPSALTPARIADRDVIVLANIQLLPDETIQSLLTAVNDGTGILITVGDRSDKASRDRLRDLFALPIREIHGHSGALRGNHGLEVGSIQTQIPGAKDLAGAGSESLHRAHVFRYAVLAQVPAGMQGVHSWITLENGAPLLIERRLGRGRLMLLTTSIDLDWTDMPAHPGYVQLVSVLMQHLSGQSSEAGGQNFVPGQRWSLPVQADKEVREIQVIPPTSEVNPTGELFSSPNGSSIQIRNADAPGFYTVWVRTSDNQEYAEKFAVNILRPKETEPLATAEAIQRVRRDATSANTATTDVRVDAEVAAASGTPIWPFLLFALLILLITESYAALKV
jgi:hypothetical protein